jgi:Zn-dependent protease with chaperone function
MDFFTQQEKARKKTGLLVFFFILAVMCIIASIYATITIILLSNRAIDTPWRPEILFVVAAGTLLVVGAGSFFKINQLRKGGAAVAAMLGAVPVSPETKDLKERQLLNVVEEMAIASGTGMPEVYLLDEPGINAFAAGWKTTDAAVCVTRGCLDSLSRDELQGVIAHEFSHVLNGDMRLNIRLMGFIFGILVIGQIGYWVLRGSGGRGVRVRSKGKGGGAGLVIAVALALLVIGYIGVFFGNLIQAAVSRAREYLADSSAVQFTRNPAGIGGALKKIGAFAGGSRISHPNAGQASHMFFANGLTGFWSNIFATHPPLEKRIKLIDPAFNGDFSQIKTTAPLPQASGARARQQGTPTAPRASSEVRFNAPMMLASVGSLTPEHVAYSAKLIDAIPNQVRLAVLDKNGAQAALFGLLLSKDSAVRALQLETITTAFPAVAPRVAEIAADPELIDRQVYAAVCSLAANSLRTITAADYPLFITTLRRLIEADGRIDLFEFMLQRMVRSRIAPRFAKNNTPKRTVSSIDPLKTSCATVLSALAWEGARTAEEAENAFKSAAALFPRSALQLLPREQCTFAALDKCLDELDTLAPPVKKQVLAACMAAASTDGVITLNESEYLRAVADALSCPMPPLIVPQTGEPAPTIV